MANPFRDELDAALARVERLERENEALRRRCAAKVAPRPRRSSFVSFTLLASALSGAAVLLLLRAAEPTPPVAIAQPRVALAPPGADGVAIEPGARTPEERAWEAQRRAPPAPRRVDPMRNVMRAAMADSDHDARRAAEWQLRQRFAWGRASAPEVALLRSFCEDEGDRACVERCDARLAAIRDLGATR